MNRAANLLAMMRGGGILTTLQRREQVGRITLDWREYFRVFCEEHGGNPVVHRGRQLFADGFTYSISDYAGPEWPPPNDPRELLELKRAYWNERRKIVTDGLREVRQTLDRIRSAQAGRSAPLQQVSVVVGEDGGRRAERTEVDLSFLEERERWLAEDLADCRAKLEGLK